MKTLTTNIAKYLTVAFLLGTASLANAGTAVVTVTDNYLYESLIQAEFDIENKMQASVAQSSTDTLQQVLMAANALDNDQIQIVQTRLSQTDKAQTDKAQTDMAQIENVVAE